MASEREAKRTLERKVTPEITREEEVARIGRGAIQAEYTKLTEKLRRLLHTGTLKDVGAVKERGPAGRYPEGKDDGHGEVPERVQDLTRIKGIEPVYNTYMIEPVRKSNIRYLISNQPVLPGQKKPRRRVPPGQRVRVHTTGNIKAPRAVISCSRDIEKDV